jgi:subfamily B ATP-binding cassette protein MsbA
MRQFRRIVSWMKPYRLRIIGALVCMGLVSGSTVVAMWLIKPLLDEGLFARPADAAARHAAMMKLVWLAAGAAGVMAVKAMARFGQDYLVGYVGHRVMYDLRMALFRKLQSLSLSYFNEKRTGELLSRVISDVGAMQMMLTQLFGPAVSSILSVIALSGYLLWVKWELAAAALLVFPIAVWPTRAFGRRLRKYSRNVQELSADLSSHLEETLSQMKLVKAYQGEEREMERWRRKLSEQLTVLLRTLRVQARSSPLMEAIGALGFSGMVVCAGYFILLRGSMSGGELGSFVGATLSLYPNIKHLNGLWNSIQTGMGAAERVFPVLDEKPAVFDADGAAALPQFSRSVDFREVSFAYRPDLPVLHSVSFSIHRGQRVALVGPSGSGKTTLADLLMRFYDPTHGAVLVDGHDIKKVLTGSLRDQVALVSQEVLLFNATARENLLYARPTATEEEMYAAARAAAAHNFLFNLPQGYDTVIGERGVKLSGGERQRLSIARAFLKNSPILILDEATAALDAASEAQIQTALEQLMANRTVLIIAHRLATVRKADLILVMEAGKVLERGTHEGLYAQNGLYKKLCDLQFQEAPSA